jgi:hypothetical protein
MILHLLFLLFISTQGALPPGYEDRLFCPKSYCLGRKHPGAGIVGSKTLFWECRFGSVGDPDDEKGKPIPVTSWGPRLDKADEKLKEYESMKYHSNKCSVLHGTSSDGIYTVVTHDDDDDYKDSVDLAGDEVGGPTMTSMIIGAAAILCFILFCCISSALGGGNNSNFDSNGSIEVNHAELESTIDVDKVH